MTGPCKRCDEPCTYVAMVWSDHIQPEPVCTDCALIAVDLITHAAYAEGVINVDFIPLEPLDESDLQ